MRAQHEWPAPKRTLRAHPLTPIPPSRLLQSMNYIASHLRFHINGNAMYRMGPAMASLLTSARRDLGNAAPFDLALYFVRRLNTSHAHANPRVYSIGAMVAEEHLLDAAYYGPTNDLAFVHVPRRLRVPAVQAAASRIDANRTAVAVVVPPGGGAFGLPSSSTLPGGDLLANTHASLAQAGMREQTLYIALDRAGFERALALAPFRVVLAGGADTSKTLGAQIHSAATAVMALRAAASFSDAGVSLLVIGPSAVAGRASLSLALVGLNATDTDTLWLQARAAAPLVVATGDPPLLDIGAMVIPGTRRASTFVRAWASAVMQGDQWTRTASGIAAVVLDRCSTETGSVPERQENSITASCLGLQAATLPAEQFQAAPTLQHPLWSVAARRAVAALVTAGPDPGTAAFHLRQAGLWQVGAGSVDWPCTTYSAVAHGPLPVADLATTHQSLSSHAAFLRFARLHNLACGVLPGFVVSNAGGHAVPYDAVLHRGQVAGLAAPGMRIVPRVADFGPLAYEAFISAAIMPQGYGHAHYRHGVPGQPPSARASHHSGPASQSLALAATTHAGAGHACVAFNLPGTTCFSPAVATDVEAAVHALQRLHSGHLHCIMDASRTPAEVAVLGMEGRTGAIRDSVVAMVGASTSTPTTILLTGAWRTLPAGAFHQGGGHTSPPAPQLLLGEGTGPAPPPPSNRTSVITLADLVLGGRPATTTAASSIDVPVKSPDEDAGLSPFADIVEYALCQGEAVEIHDLATLMPLSPVPADLAVRVAAHIPPDRLAADLNAFATWLARPDRPSLGGRVLWARWPALGPLRPADAVDGVMSALDLADAAGVPLVGLPAAWAAACHGDPAALHALYSTARNLLPPSIAVMLDPVRVVDAVRGWSSPVSRNAHPASVDSVLADPRHAAALGAVQRVLHAKAKRGAGGPVYVAVRGAPLPRGRMRGLRPLVRANDWGAVMDFGVGNVE